MEQERLSPEPAPEPAKRLARLFLASPESVEKKLRVFPKYVREAPLRRFLTLSELFRRVLSVKGSIVECGVYRGFSLMTWAKLSSILEPTNVSRRIYGFDSFAGFPAVREEDRSAAHEPRAGELAAASEAELREAIAAYDAERCLGQIPRVTLVPGDMVDTIPAFVAQHRHLVVSLLFLDCDLYEPTRVALEHFLPRMPRGALLAFDELDRPTWPGETAALLATRGISGLRLRRLPWEPDISYAVLE